MKVSGVSVQVSALPLVASDQSNRERNYSWSIALLQMVGAVFNREYPGNRGRPATSSPRLARGPEPVERQPNRGHSHKPL